MYETPQISQARAILSSVLLDAQSTAESLAATAAQLLAGHPLPAVGGVLLPPELRQALQTAICQALQGNPLCNGAGFASYAAAARDAKGYWTLEWWRQEEQAIQQAQLEWNQEQRQRLDFRVFDWFDQPARRHLPVLEGPYVDYVCNGAYTITAAHPVLLGAHFAGVAAVDVLVSTLERLLMPVLGRIGAPAVVVNRDARIVVSTAPGLRAGMLWKAGAPAAVLARHEPAPMRLVVLAASPPPRGGAGNPQTPRTRAGTAAGH